MIQINPLQSYIDGGARAAITSPPSASLVFDLPGKAIWVKGVKLKGTDHTYTFSNDNYITLTNTPDQNNPESEDIKIGVNITALKNVIDTTYTTGTFAQLQAGTNTAAQVWTAKVLAEYVTGNIPTTQKMKVNGTDYSIYTTSASLPTFLAPTALGTSGQILSCTSNGLTWINQIQNTDYKVSQSPANANEDYRVLLKQGANNDPETTFVRYSEYLTFNPSTKSLKINSSKVVTFADIYVGATASTNGTAGLVPAATSVNKDKFLKGDGTWDTPSNVAVWEIEVDKASFALTQEWADSGVGLSGLSPGPCLLYINYCGVHYTGIFAYSGTTINTDDEFPLHCSGYTQLDRGRIFAKIAAVQGATKLMLAAQKPETNIPLFTIKIKQIAIL